MTAIAAPAALEVEFFGDGGHAGAQLMPYRCCCCVCCVDVEYQMELAGQISAARPAPAASGAGMQQRKRAAVIGLNIFNGCDSSTLCCPATTRCNQAAKEGGWADRFVAALLLLLLLAGMMPG